MTPLPVVIAIPARNEADRIGACLAAIASQPDAPTRIAGVIVFANNCTDDTVAVAAAMAVPFPINIITANLPPDRAHIGQARRGANDAAIDFVNSAGMSDAIIAGTDADSRVAPEWLAALTTAFAADVDAVCGAIDIDGPVPPALARVRTDEAAYAEITARAADHLDPRPHDRFPNHIWCWGANLAVRATVLTAVGGSPLVDLAEDRALHSALLRHDARIRHTEAVRVLTSARTDGRAPGGFADLMARYATDRNALADFWLEPAGLTWLRATQRGAARRAWTNGKGFGAHWAEWEANCSTLAPRPLAIADLQAETMALERLLRDEAGRSCSRARGAATVTSHPAIAPR